MADLRELKAEHGDQIRRKDEYGNPIHENKGEAGGFGEVTGSYGTTPHEGILGGGGEKKGGAGVGQAAYGAGQGEYRAHAGEKKGITERAAAKLPDHL